MCPFSFDDTFLPASSASLLGLPPVVYHVPSQEFGSAFSFQLSAFSLSYHHELQHHPDRLYGVWQK